MKEVQAQLHLLRPQALQTIFMLVAPPGETLRKIKICQLQLRRPSHKPSRIQLSPAVLLALRGGKEAGEKDGARAGKIGVAGIITLGGRQIVSFLFPLREMDRVKIAESQRSPRGV